MPGDNFHFDICSEGQHHFDMALEIAFGAHSKAVGYRIDKERGLILYWAQSKNATPLPYVMDVDAAKPFVRNWLQTAEYPDEPDHDGDNGKGFRIFNEAWGHVGSEYEAFVAICPAWQMYGK